LESQKVTKDDETVLDDGVEQLKERILHSLAARAVVGWKRVVLDSWTKNKEDGRRNLEACLALVTEGCDPSRHVLPQNLLDYSRAENIPQKVYPCTLGGTENGITNAFCADRYGTTAPDTSGTIVIERICASFDHGGLSRPVLRLESPAHDLVD
jgi:hypothetical protein